VTGALTLAGVDPDTTPLHLWVGAAWAALIQFMGTPVTVEALNKLWSSGFDRPDTQHGEPDRDTWGLLPEHLAGQQRLIDGLGG
jgi:hypothetical protein